MVCGKNYVGSFYLFETLDWAIELVPEDESIIEGLLDDYDVVIVTISQRDGATISKSSKDSGISVDTETNTINLSLTQSETGAFSKGDAEIQINVKFNNSNRKVSVKGNIQVLDNLYKEVI